MAYLRTVLMYLVLLIVIRLMGKRQIGQMEPSEFVVTMLIANLASIPLENLELPLKAGLIPILTVLGAELLLSLLTLKSVVLRKLLCGKPVILVENGRPLRQNLRRNRVTLDELMGHLRQKDVMDITQVQYAILETNGSLSVFLYSDHEPASAREAGIRTEPRKLPTTLILDGFLFREDLRRMGKDESWLQKALSDRKLRKKDVLLMTLDDDGTITVLPKKE